MTHTLSAHALRACAGATLTLALGGCCSLPIGDEVFTVNGTAPPAQACDVFLRTEGGLEVPSTRRRVSGDFRESYPMTYCTGSYHVIVTCDGAERRLAVYPR